MIVDEASATTVTTRNFWPRPLYARPWNFEKYADSRLAPLAGAQPPEANDFLSIPKNDPPRLALSLLVILMQTA